MEQYAWYQQDLSKISNSLIVSLFRTYLQS